MASLEAIDLDRRRNAMGSGRLGKPEIVDQQFLRYLIIFNGMIPLAILAWDASCGQIGANAVNQALHITGIVSLVFLFLSLAMTPLRRMTGWGSWIGFRRALGLYGFFYAVVHLAIYYYFDRAGDLSSTIHEIWKRRFLQIGFIAVLLMVPLAVTSTNAMVRRMGAKQWKLLHRLAYLATTLGVIHYFLLVKSDIRQPLAFGAVLAILLASRLGRDFFGSISRKNRTATLPERRKIWTGELRVVHVFDETPLVRTFRLVPKDPGVFPFDFRPGQYLNLHLTISGHRVNRSYTIASSPTRCGYCELSIKREENGIASTYLHRQIKVGDCLRVTAPAGKFIFDGSDSDSVVLIGGGVGITPLMSITRYLTDLGWSGEIYLLLVAKSPRDIIFQDELHYLQKRLPNLHVKITLTQVGQDEHWTGDRGRPTCEWLKQCVPQLLRSRVYLCGPNEMMNSTRELLHMIGVNPARVLTEAFVSPPTASHIVEQESTSLAPQTPSDSRSRDEVQFIEKGSVFAEVFSASFLQSGRTVTLESQTNLLEAAEFSGIDLPFECRSGICGQCKVKLVKGSVAMEVEDALTSSEKQAGWILACQSRCQTDVTIDA